MSSQSTTLAAAAVYLDRASLEPPLRLLLLAADDLHSYARAHPPVIE
jgi:hypothetical protein